jgi:rod shape-determining protein MreC
VLLINDLNSRIPVVIERSREQAILAGDNSVTPRLLYLPITTTVQVGDRIVTSGHGGAFPVGLPVGVVTSISEEGVRVVPYADATNIEYVRLMDYGLEGILDDSDDDDLAAGGMSRSTKRGRR